LLRCLKSIVDQRGQYGSFEIHIIDNDCDPVVEGMVIDFKQETRSQLYYHKEPKRGVASARNGALAVVSHTMDYVAFIDDDEIASPFWLESMLTTAEQFSASIVQGPVEPQFEDPVPGWFRNSRITALGPFREGEELRFGFSGIGYYPDWEFQGIKCGGLHLDTRPLGIDSDGTLNYCTYNMAG
jgi:glycosyltransferase involved in cell wall biosynthesis